MKTRSTIKVKFKQIMGEIISSKEVFTIFVGLCLTIIDSILEMSISKLRSLSFAQEEKNEPLKL